MMTASKLATLSPRESLRLLNPRLAVLVTCIDSSGTPNVLTVAWHTQLSIDPPLVGVSIGLTRYSYQLLDEIGEYVINIVGEDQEQAVEICGTHSGIDTDKFALAGLETISSSYVSPPILADALGYLECRIEQAFLVGDHTLFVGRVLGAAVREDAYHHGWEVGSARLLLSLGGDRYITPTGT